VLRASVFGLRIQHLVTCKADRRALGKRIVQFWWFFLGSGRKKNCANTTQGENFLARGLSSPLERETAAVSSLARKNGKFVT